jgi:hypothetical protein
MKNMHTRNAIIAFVIAVAVLIYTVYLYLTGYVLVLFRVLEIPLPIAWGAATLLLIYAVYELVTGPKKDAEARMLRAKQQAAQQVQGQFLAPCTVRVTRHLDRNSGIYGLTVLCNGSEVGKVTGNTPLVFSTLVAENDLTVIYPSGGLEETMHFRAFNGGSSAFLTSTDGKAILIEEMPAQ